MNETIFFNVWRTDSRESQAGLLAAMRVEAPALAAKPGFLGLTVWSGEDGRVLVKGRWASRAHFEAAIGSPEMKEGRSRLERFGKSEPGLFTPNFEAGPVTQQASDATDSLRREAGERWAARGFTTEMIRVNGVDLHVASGGAGSPLVLLHGYPQSGEIWRFVAPEFVKTHRVIIPDLRGMGLSEIVNDGFDLPNVADDLHELMAKLRVQGAVAVGHDWGGAIGAVWALKHRGDIQKFAFIESAVGGAGFEKIWTFDRPNPALTFIPFLLTDTLAEPLIAGREEIFLHHLWSAFTHNKNRVPFDAWQPYIDAMKRPGLIRSSAGYYREVYGAAGRVQELIAAGKLTLPVLSISGEASLGEAQKPFVEAFASKIVKHVTVANCGHFAAEEQPEALAAELRGFLAE
jgi:pimeloyl-ACP methyl ester carboxylesterase/heme-degrading monooxygenase HmoA